MQKPYKQSLWPLAQLEPGPRPALTGVADGIAVTGDLVALLRFVGADLRVGLEVLASPLLG